MIGKLSQAQLEVELTFPDKVKGEKEGVLECTLFNVNSPKLIIHIVEEVLDSIFPEEQGFHMELTRPDRRKQSAQYDLYLSKEVFGRLTTPPIISPICGGNFSTRTIYDRVDISYFEI